MLKEYLIHFDKHSGVSSYCKIFRNGFCQILSTEYVNLRKVLFMVKVPITYFLNFEARENFDGEGEGKGKEQGQEEAREEIEFEVRWMCYF